MTELNLTADDVGKIAVLRNGEEVDITRSTRDQYPIRSTFFSWTKEGRRYIGEEDCTDIVSVKEREMPGYTTYTIEKEVEEYNLTFTEMVEQAEVGDKVFHKDDACPLAVVFHEDREYGKKLVWKLPVDRDCGISDYILNAKYKIVKPKKTVTMYRPKLIRYIDEVAHTCITWYKSKEDFFKCTKGAQVQGWEEIEVDESKWESGDE